ncbi:MAG TPA: response regulator [Caldimonas sp.]|jgi:two-component system LytT family response regulator|nr:response regulator [Caldimonas sp.]HEX4235486.1 response regulator [Caldimonas sp.]
MRVLIVDDEAPARAKLRRMLGGFADVEIVGEAGDGGAALELVARAAPDALFLDIQMPEIGGFDLAASLPDNAPALVFVTAFDQYALQAFEAQAIDYLLKPIVPDRLDLALQRLRVFVRGAKEGHSNGRTRTGPPRQLLVADRGRTHVVRCADIAWIEAADNYVQLHVGGRSLLMRRTFTGLLADLGPPFVRTHRSAAIALAQVRELRPRENGDAIVVLHDDTQVPCSRLYRNRLVALLTS